MNALHYAAYFDVPELIRVILKTSKPKGKYCKIDHTDSSGSNSGLKSFYLALLS